MRGNLYPRRDDFDTDEEYEEAVDLYEEAMEMRDEERREERLNERYGIN